MARIKSRDTGPELKLRKCLWSRGRRYRLKSGLTGKPDLVFTRKKVAVFVDGCFWHGCSEHGVMPKSNADYWQSKITNNKARDAVVTEKLGDGGWNVLRIWEHEIMDDVERVANRIIEALDQYS